MSVLLFSGEQGPRSPIASDRGGIPEDYFTPGRNVIPDPGFDSGAYPLPPYMALDTGVTPDCRLICVPDPVITGQYSMQVGQAQDPGLAPDVAKVEIGWTFATQPGAIWSAAAMAGFCTADYQARMDLYYLNAAGTILLFTTASTPPGQVQPGRLFIHGIQAPETTTTIRLALALLAGDEPVDAPARAVFDELLLTEAPLAGSIIAGGRGGSQWDGVRYWSASSRRGEADVMADMKGWMPPAWYSDPAAV